MAGNNQFFVGLKARLKQFWEIPGHEDAEGPLRVWYTHVNSKTVTWQSEAQARKVLIPRNETDSSPTTPAWRSV
jgi:hypothetical protein